MRTQFKIMKLPLNVYNNFKNKAEKLEKIQFNITGKERNIPISKVVMASSFKEIYLSDLEIRQLTKRRVFHI